MSVQSFVSGHTDRSVQHSGSLLKRSAILSFGIGSYLVGFATLIVLILTSLGVFGFRGGPPYLSDPWAAALFDIGLLALFGVQHSVMARPGFKRRWTRLIDPSMERSMFVLATGVVLLPLVALWQWIPGVVWSLNSSVGREIVTGIALLGWAYLLLATFAIDHFELFGLQQSWRGFRGLLPVPVAFRERWMYRVDRHPIMTGVLIGLWATPEMTVGRLLFTAGLSVYAVIGVHFEERSLRRELGDAYESYRRRVPALVPTFASSDPIGQADNPALLKSVASPREEDPFSVSTLIAAPPERVWAPLADVRHWPDWLPTMRSVEPLGPEALTLGARYRITQPKLRPAIWTVVGLEPLRAFSWETLSPGVRVLADHSLSPQPDGSTRATLQIRFSGPLAFVARWLGGSLTREYLHREATLLKQKVEAQS